MRSPRFWSLAAVLLAINLAGIIWIHHDLTRLPKLQCRVLSTWPTTAVEQSDHLTLVLSEPLATAERVGKPIDRPPFVIQPAAAGHWQWAAADKLEYMLDKPLLPGRTYYVKPSGDLEGELGRELAGDREFMFKTEPLRVNYCRLGVCEPTAAVVELSFNQPVSPGDLMRHLIVVDAAAGAGQTKLEASCLTNAVGTNFVIHAARPHSQMVRLVLDGKLAGFGAELGLGKDFQQDFKIATEFALLGCDVERPGLEKNVTVKLHFSNPLDSAQALPEATVSPKVAGLKVSRDKANLVLEGEFACGKSYTASVPATLMSADKQTLKEKSTESFDIPDRQPSLEMTAGRGILMPQGNLLLDMEAVNVSGVEVGASRLHANNLVTHVNGRRSETQTSRELKTHSFKLDLPRNVPQTVALDLRKVLGQPLGVYNVSVGYNESRWDNANAVVTITDLGLTAKRHKDGYTIWVTSLRTGKPVEDVKVSAYSRNNQVLASGSTDGDGLARLALTPNHPDGGAFLIAAERDGDMSYVVLNDRAWGDDDYVGDSGRAIPTTYDVLVYCERGIYRPGEMIHVTGIVRDAAGRIPPPMPLSLHVDRPDGKTVAKIAIAPDAGGQGVFHAEYQPAEDAQMGEYHLTVTLPGDKVSLGETSALVEAFVPVRMEVKAKATKEVFGPGEVPEVEGSSRYLFGLPGADLSTQVGGHYRAANFTSSKYADYLFDTAGGMKKDGLAIVQTRTDDKGQFRAKLEVPAEPKRLWQGVYVATVTETGGRGVTASFGFRVDTIGRHIGLRLPESRIVAVQTPTSVDWVMVDSKGEATSDGKLEWKLQRVEWDWVVEQVNGQPVWKNQERLIAAGEGKVAAGTAVGKIEVSCSDAGQYRLSVKDTASGAEAVQEFYASRGSDAGSNVAKPERLEIVLDRKSYVPGGSAKVLVRSPFAGQMLLTLETDRIVDTRVVEMAGKQMELDLPVPPDLRGGAFVTASVVRAVDPEDSKWMPHRAMGIARLVTDHSAAKLDVAIDAPAKVLPGGQVQVTVKTGRPFDAKRPGVVHVWAVDEGILLTTAFRTPDPFGFFFMPRKLGVETCDLYSLLLPDYKRPAGIARIGAGGDEERAMRRSPVPVRVKQSTVVWNKVLPVDENGQVSVTMDVPKFTGELRLMAVAVDHDRYGAGKRAMTVTSPLLVESSWPRFAAPGDKFKVPVKVFNTTSMPVSVAVNVEANGPVELSAYPSGVAREPGSAAMPVASQPASVRLEALAAGTSKVIWLNVTAKDLGQVEVNVSAKGRDILTAKDLVATDEAKFTIRPAVPLTAETKLVKFAAGTTQTIEPSGDWMVGRTTVSLSGRPDVQLRPAIEQLIAYPYGCVEQTTSKLYAILYAPDLLVMAGAGEGRTAAIRQMVDAGITRLWSMQTRDGGLGYWPGDSQSNLWGTAYAASFLVRAKKAGFPVDKRFTDSLLDYISLTLKKTDSAECDDNMRALMCNVLATFGRPAEGWMNRLSDNLDKLDIAGRANLAGAWLEMGKKDRAAAMLAEDTLKINVGFSAGGRITSTVSQQAVLLDTLLDIDASHAWVGVLVGELEKARKRDGGWGNTHENAMCLAALAHYQVLSKDEASDFNGTLKMDGQAAVEFGSAKAILARTTQPAAGMEIETKGKGSVYAVVTTEGMRRGEKFRPYDRRLVVRREWKDSLGQSVDQAHMYVGQLVQVEVNIKLTGEANSDSVENIAIVDALPGGLEVENPRLATSGCKSGQGVVPDRTQFMDDRVVMFCTAGKKEQKYVYHLRVTTAGRFELPPIQASCMYDSEIASINGGGVVDVSDVMPKATSKPTSGPASKPTTQQQRHLTAETTENAETGRQTATATAPAAVDGDTEEMSPDDTTQPGDEEDTAGDDGAAA